MFWRHYVYLHRKADTGEPFYVGKGSVRRRRKSIDFERANSSDSRNQWWHNIVGKHGLIIEIVTIFEDDISSQDFEKELILHYGRINCGNGSLVNLTDGGDGHAGLIASDSLKKKRGENSKGPRSKKWVKSIRAARKNGGNGGVVKRGDKLSKEWRENISKGVMGAGNSMYGKTGEQAPRRREVVDIETGITYPTVTSAAESVGINMKTLYNMLGGYNTNKTSLRFAR